MSSNLIIKDPYRLYGINQVSTLNSHLTGQYSSKKWTISLKLRTKYASGQVNDMPTYVGGGGGGKAHF